MADIGRFAVEQACDKLERFHGVIGVKMTHAQWSLSAWMNVLSGAGFVINSGWNGAYPSAFINVIWAAIGLYGVFGRQLGAHFGTAG